MRTSLTEAKEIEDWLFQRGNISGRLVTEARMLSNPKLMDRVKWQSISYELIRLHGRKKLLEEIKAVEHQLFSVPKYRSFQKRIQSIFKR